MIVRLKVRFTLKKLIAFKCFNSMIVRLKENASVVLTSMPLGFNSMIVRLKVPAGVCMFVYIVRFQFYDSPIKSVV